MDRTSYRLEIENVFSSDLSSNGLSELTDSAYKISVFLEKHIFTWIYSYSNEKFRGDIIAGITVFFLLIPQGISYAVLAGVPPVYGLYTSVIPPLTYSIFGSSMQLSIGPMAIISLLISTSMQSLGYDQLSSREYVEYAEVMSFNCGIQLFIMGILSMGQLTNFLSSSVISGFTTGSALLIALTQIKYILGYENVPRFVYTHDLIIYLLVNIGNTNLVAFFIGITSIVFLYWVKLWKQNNKPSGSTNDRKFKVLYALSNGSSLATIFFGILIAYITISNNGILPVVGHIPSGFKMPAIPKKLNVKTMRDLFPSSFILSLVIFMNNWAVAVKYAAKNKYEVHANLELIASGVSNLSGSFFNCFPSAGGLARSSVNAESGAQTPLSGVITGLLIFISLMSITSIFYYIPMASLGAIIQISVISMMDFEQLKYAYKVDKNDFIVILTTILITIFVSPMYGIILGLFTSMLFVIESCAFPNIAHLGRVSMNVDDEENMYNNNGGSKEYYYKDIKRFENAVQVPGVAIIRMDAPLFFANCSYFKKVVTQASHGEFHTDCAPIKFIIFDTSGWSNIDLTGLQMLNDLHEELVGSNVQLAFANTKGPIRDRLSRAKFVEKLGERFMHISIDDAINSIKHRRNSIQDEIDILRNYRENMTISSMTMDISTINPFWETEQRASFEIEGSGI